jgi:hypothetical protein
MIRIAQAHGAWGNRPVSLASVAVFLLATHASLADADTRASVQYLFVVTLGYGHLLGAVLLPRARPAPASSGSSRALLVSFLVVSALTGFAAYAWVVGRAPTLMLPLLAVSAWHTVENDLAIGRAYANGLRVGPLPRGWTHHVVSLAVTGLVVLLGTRTESWGELAQSLGRSQRDRAASVTAGQTRWPPFVGRLDLPDLFVLVTLHHLLSWLILLADRVRALRAVGRGDEAARLLRLLAGVHLAPALVCVLLLALPSPRAGSLHLFVFGPAVYLYWSVLHVVQTIWRRGIEPRRGALPVQGTASHS